MTQFKRHIVLLLTIVLVGSLFLPLEIPYTFESVAKVYPLREWVLQKTPEGTLSSSIQDYKSGQLHEFASFQFERGDVVHIRFNPENQGRMQLDSGEMVAGISSYALEDRIVRLENNLAVARATLSRDQAGSKPEIVSAASEEVKVIEEELELNKKLYVRAQRMFGEGLIPKVELERMQGAYETSLARLELSRSKIEVENTGEKPEQLQLLKAQIRAFEKEINYLKSRKGDFKIYAPHSGKLSFHSDENGEYMKLEDTSEYILYFPIKIKNKYFVNKNAKIELELPGRDSLVQVRLLGVGDDIEILQREKIVMAKASIGKNQDGLIPGMPLACKITCDKVSPLEYIKRATKLEIK